MDLIEALDLEAAGDHRYRAHNTASAGGVVFGGQLLAQSIVAAARTVPDKEVKSIHIVFARGASADEPLDVDVEPMHDGRAFGSATVTIRQGERLCTRALVLAHRPDPDLIRHAAEGPAVGDPTLAPPAAGEGSSWEVRVVGGVDINDPDAVGPAELNVWSRFAGGPHDHVTSQAMLGYASDGFLIGTAMRPHAGVGQALAHRSISTSVVSHTLTFHEQFDAGRWLLLAQESPYAGRGRSYGRAQVFDEDGRLVASFVQENMVRDQPGGRTPDQAPGKY
ncbi:MAG: thioesterase family protein [Acidimicrobiales bacterium]